MTKSYLRYLRNSKFTTLLLTLSSAATLRNVHIQQKLVLTDRPNQINLTELLKTYWLQALQSEAVKLEQFQKRLLQRNSELQQKLRNMDFREFENSCVALSPSTDTGMTSSSIYCHICLKMICAIILSVSISI